MRTYYTAHKRPDKKPFLIMCSEPVLVETSGYRNAKTQIMDLIAAGMHLRANRDEMYDHVGNRIDESYYDITREKDFTEMDAINHARTLNERFKRAGKAASKVKKDSKDDTGKSDKVVEDGDKDSSTEIKSDRAPEDTE